MWAINILFLFVGGGVSHRENSEIDIEGNCFK